MRLLQVLSNFAECHMTYMQSSLSRECCFAKQISESINDCLFISFPGIAGSHVLDAIHDKNLCHDSSAGHGMWEAVRVLVCVCDARQQ